MTTQCNCDDTCKPTYTMLPIQGFGIAIDSSALPTCKCDGTSGGGSISYSLEEQWTGKYWIDGKKVYQKTVDTGGLTNATAKKVLHNVANMDRLVFIYGVAVSSVASIPMPYASIRISTDTVGKSIVIQPESDCRQYTESHVTIQYTCTDR